MSGCCSELTQQQAPPDRRGSCPGCARAGRAVETITLKALLRPGALARLEARTSYHFCPTPECPIVYFAIDSESVYSRKDLKVRVGKKETKDPIPICYCFGHTRASIVKEILRTGRSTALETISDNIRAARCGCEVNNPSGACCLAEVRAVIKIALKQRVAEPTRGAKS